MKKILMLAAALIFVMMSCHGLWFSFHCQSINTNGMDKVVKTMLEHNYTCDEWAGWNGCNKRH